MSCAGSPFPHRRQRDGLGGLCLPCAAAGALLVARCPRALGWVPEKPPSLYLVHHGGQQEAQCLRGVRLLVAEAAALLVPPLAATALPHAWPSPSAQGSFNEKNPQLDSLLIP